MDAQAALFMLGALGAPRPQDAEIVRLLLAAGADREQRTSKGRTAEQIALEENLLGSHKEMPSSERQMFDGFWVMFKKDLYDCDSCRSL